MSHQDIKYTSNKMAFLLLLPLCLNLASLITAAGNDQFVYCGFTGTNLTINGSAGVTPDGLLQLTSGTANVKGHAFYPTPLHLRNSINGTVQSFSVIFVFGIVSALPDFSADGMAFFISPNKNFGATMADGYLGLMNNLNNGNASNHIFAVELDTIQNAEFMDINDNHVGVNINGLQSVQSFDAGYYDEGGNFQNLELINRQVMQVWVDYYDEKKQINVTLAPLKRAKPLKPLLSITYDLSSVLTEPVYIGFSAETGHIRSLNSRHYVLGWSFGINNTPAPPIDIVKLPDLLLPSFFYPKKSSKVLDIVLPIVATTVLFVLGVIIVILVRKRLRYAELREDWEVEFGPHRFSYKDLFRATDGFKDKHLLGVGGFGKVYKGVLPTSKLEVAVKRVSHESRQGIKEFIAEIVSIGRLRHRNLVQLLGYCRRKGELLLVYEYMPNGSLDKYLHIEEDTPTLEWAQRFHIIRGVASGLFYLHEEWEKVVIHRDIKASNVLLDCELNAHLGDFGLARLYEHGNDLQTTHMAGTFGYIAPEIARTGKASPQTDVYAFGIFILEVTCGRKPINNCAHDGPKMLVDWVIEHWHKGSHRETLDMRLQADYNADEVNLVFKLGLLCAHPFCNARPSMRQVMQYLNRDTPLPELMPTNLSYSMLGLMQNNGFDQENSLPSAVCSNGLTSSLASGR